MSITTKTGDDGETGLFNGGRVKKNDPRIIAIGELDELNSFLAGLNLESIQRVLMELSGVLAGADAKLTEILQAALNEMETKIKQMEDELPPLTQFIVPGGPDLAIRAYQARAVARRAERAVSALPGLPQNVLPYLNRLSDYLFLLARKFTHDANEEDKFWHA